MLNWFRRGKKSQPIPAAAPAPRQLSYRIASLQGQGSRERQEDAFCILNAHDVTMIRENGLLAVVADGMGGMKDGALASLTVVSSLQSDFAAWDRAGNLPGQMRQSVIRAGQAVYDTIGGDGGSTLVMCLFYRQTLCFASVGDSYLYLLRNRLLIRLNREQNVLHREYLRQIRRGQLRPEAARQTDEAAALSQFLGRSELDDIDDLKHPLPLQAGDVLLLCSDGIAGGLREDELLACLCAGSPELACAALERAVLRQRNPYQDNYTALVVQCEI